MTASISRNAFFYGVSESIGQTAIAYGLTAARYTVIAYDCLTSDSAKATYRWIGNMTIALGQLAFWATVWAYAKTSEWAEAEVQSCVAQPTEPNHVPDAENMVEADPFNQPEMVAAAMAPVATLVVKVEATDYAAMKTPQLRQLCSQRGITWRNAHGLSKHLSKGEMVAALA